MHEPLDDALSLDTSEALNARIAHALCPARRRAAIAETANILRAAITSAFLATLGVVALWQAADRVIETELRLAAEERV